MLICKHKIYKFVVGNLIIYFWRYFIVQSLFLLDCTPPYRVTIVTDNTNNALGIPPLAMPEEPTVLSRGKYLL